MSPRFLAAVNFVLDHETVFAPKHAGDYRYAIAEHVPGDPGGETKFGIDQRDHPEVNVDELTLAGARQIYYTSEWGPSHAEVLPLGIGEVCFDAAVNCGVQHAIVWLQTALQNQGFYHGGIDGRIGPLTLAAATRCPIKTVQMMLALRNSYYERLVAVRPAMAKFLKGWLNRDNDLAAFATPLTALVPFPVIPTSAPAFVAAVA